MGNPDEEPANDEGQCFTDKTKDCCATYVYWVSFLLLVLAIVTGVYGYLSYNGTTWRPAEAKGYVDINISANSVIGILAILGAILALTVSILGFFLQRCKNFCFAVPFAIITFVAAILALAFGAAVFGGNLTTQVQQQLCNKSAVLTDHYKALIDGTMCGPACKCDPGASDVNKLLWTKQSTDKTSQW
jgi:uncharacterized membrane protein